MIIWNDKKLADDLKADAVSERQSFWYFIVLLALSTITWTTAAGAYIFQDVEINVWDYASDALLIMTVLVSGIVCFLINQKGDNKDFIKRYTCLTIPVAIRATVFGFIPYVVIIFALAYFYGDTCYESLPQSWCEQYIDADFEAVSSTAIDLMLVAVISVYSLYRSVFLFKRIAGKAA